LRSLWKGFVGARAELPGCNLGCYRPATQRYCFDRGVLLNAWFLDRPLGRVSRGGRRERVYVPIVDERVDMADLSCWYCGQPLEPSEVRRAEAIVRRAEGGLGPREVYGRVSLCEECYHSKDYKRRHWSLSEFVVIGFALGLFVVVIVAAIIAKP
jgi:hypothetical protein